MQPSSVARWSSTSEPARIVHEPVRIEIERREDVCLVHFHGPFRTGCDDPDYLRAKMDEVKTLNRALVLADLSGVPSAGSTFLGLIAGLYRSWGNRLILTGIQPRVRQVLDITGLSTVVPLAADIESGLATLRNECFADREAGAGA